MRFGALATCFHFVLTETSNLSYVTVTREEFAAFFAQKGDLIDAIVVYDRETGRSRGFGFVTFQDSEVARALLMNGNEGKDPSDAFSFATHMDMRGKKIEIKAAQPKESSATRARAKATRARKIPLVEPVASYSPETLYYPYPVYSVEQMYPMPPSYNGMVAFPYGYGPYCDHSYFPGHPSG